MVLRAPAKDVCACRFHLLRAWRVLGLEAIPFCFAPPLRIFLSLVGPRPGLGKVVRARPLKS